MILITPLPGVTTTKPGSATFPFPGIQADVVDAAGESVPLGQGGYLVLKRPWPAMLRGIYGDPERYKQTYWSRFPGMYFAGDGAKRDSDGYFWLLGRVDDVMNVSGHRLSTTEIESALVSHPAVAEAAVVGGPDPITGEAINAFVILRLGNEPSHALGEELRHHVATKISPIAKPKTLMFMPDLPKTRSGKIMRRLLRDIAQGSTLGDTTTLADAGVVELIRESSWQDRGVGQGAVRTSCGRRSRTRRRPPRAPRPPTARPRLPRRRSRPRSGVAFDGLTEEWRLVGRMSIDGRLLDSLNKREAIDDPRRPVGADRRVRPVRSGARPAERRPLRPHPRPRRRRHDAGPERGGEGRPHASTRSPTTSRSRRRRSVSSGPC